MTDPRPGATGQLSRVDKESALESLERVRDELVQIAARLDVAVALVRERQQEGDDE